MKIRTKLIALCLAISLIPVSIVGVAGLQNMQSIGTYAQDQSTTQLEEQITGELNNTVDMRQGKIQNLLDARRVDALSLADSTPVQNYKAASDGEMELVQQQSQRQVGYMALQMHSTIETTKQTILEEEYGGQSWEELSPEQQQQVEDKVERMIAGTSGNGTHPSGTMHDMFQPGYIGDTGYAYVTDSDANVVAHHSLDDGFNLKEDASLMFFNDIQATIRANPEIRNGNEWGIAEYDWEDTTQEGNPTERKFIAYTYYEDFDWVLAPSVYYYELQTTAVKDARDGINDSFQSYLNTRSVSIDGEEVPAYDEIILTDENGQGVVRAHRTDDGEVDTELVENVSYADEDWFKKTDALKKDEVHVSNVHTVDGAMRVYVATPVYRDGVFEGMIALRFNFSILASLTNDVTVGDSGQLSIVSDSGRLLTHTGGELTGVKSNVAVKDYVLDGEKGLRTYTHTGENESRYYVGYAPLQFGDKQFELLATVPEKDVTAPSAALGRALTDRTTSARNFLLVLLGGIIVVVGGLGYGAARYFSTPIEQVRDQAALLAEGRFDEDVDISAPDDEIGDLVDAFDDMQENLRRQVLELRTVSENLGEGTLDHEVRTDLPGEFGAIMSDIDDGIRKLQDGFDEIRHTSRQIKAGEFDQDVDTDLPGEYGAVLTDLEAGVQQLVDSFDQIRDASSQLRDGNLDQDLETHLPGQYGMVMSDLQAGLEEIERSLAEVRSVADRFAEMSDETVASAEEVRSASEETAESVEEIAHGAEQQTEQLQAAASEMNDLSATIEEVASSADDVVKTTNEAVSLASRGREHAADATGEITAIESEADAAVGQVEDLSEQIAEINEVVELITDIAEQTNLLALNASIEAARAGEAGEGFAVVADEIKTLASEAGTATEEVKELIDEIQDSTDETVGDMQSMRDRIDNGAETIGNAIEMFDDIAEAIEDAEHGVEEISEAAEDQAVSTEEVVAMVDEISNVSEETSAEASTVSAATEEQTAAINEVTQNVQSVSQSAQSLRDLVGQFEVGEFDGGPRAGDVTTDVASESAVTDGGTE